MALVNFTCAEDMLTIHRAISHRYPIYAFYKEKRVLLMELDLGDSDAVLFPGEWRFDRESESILLGFESGHLRIHSLKREGKNVISALDWRNGYGDNGIFTSP